MKCLLAFISLAFLILIINIGNCFGQVPNIITSPVVGDFIVGTRSQPSQTSTQWSFWQMGCSGNPNHCAGKGVGGADDRFAYDINLASNADNGQAVFAVADGTIETSQNWAGNSVGQFLIKHTEPNGNVWYSGYLHMSNIMTKRQGSFISAGTQIGRISNVSPARGMTAHLHFAVYERVNGIFVSRNVASFVARNSTQISLSSGFNISPLQNNNIVQGNTLQVRVSVRSSQALSRRFILAIHRFGDPNPLQDIGSQTVTISAGGTASLDFRNISTNGFAPGQYQLYLKTEESGGRFPAVGAGSNAPNPVAIWVVPNWQLASAITASPTTLVRNSRATFTTSIRNSGTQSWTGRFYLVLTNTSNQFIGILGGGPTTAQTIGSNQTINLRFDQPQIISNAGSYRLSLRFQNNGQSTLTTVAVMDLPSIPETSSFTNPAAIRIVNSALTLATETVPTENATSSQEIVNENERMVSKMPAIDENQVAGATMKIFPNPTHNTFTVEFELQERSDVTLKLYTQQGEELRTLASRVFEAGKHQIESNGDGLRQGTYICTLQAGSQKLSKQIILVK